MKILAWKTIFAASSQVKDSDLVDLYGLRISLVAGDQGLSKELKVFKTHEPLATSLYLKEIKKGMYIVDIGSNIGYYVLLAAKRVDSEGKILAIEPNPLTFKCLEKNVSLNRLRNVELRQIAVWDKETSVWFEASDALNLSRVINSNVISKNPGRKLICVQAARLDSLLENYERVDWLRFDVEGSEFEIIKGATRTLKRFKPNIFMEFHPKLLGIKKAILLLRKMQSYGYEIEYAITRAVDRSLIVKKDRDIRKIKLNDLIKEMKNPMPAYLLLLKKH